MNIFCPRQVSSYCQARIDAIVCRRMIRRLLDYFVPGQGVETITLKVKIHFSIDEFDYRYIGTIPRI